MYSLSADSLPNSGTTIRSKASVSETETARSREEVGEGISDDELSPPPPPPLRSVKIQDVWSPTWISNMMSSWFFPFRLLEWTTLKTLAVRA